MGKTQLILNQSPLFLKLVLASLSLLLISYFMFISYQVRPSSDDLWIYYEFKTRGFYNFFTSYPYNFRYTSFFVFGVLAELNSSFESFHFLIFSYYLILFIALYYAIFRIINSIFYRLQNQLPKIQIHIISHLLFFVIYFGTSNGIEVWFWFIGSTVYLVATLFFLLGLGEILKIGTKEFSKTMSFLYFLLFGGTAENFALATFMVLLFIAWKYKELRRYIVSILLSVSIFPIINLLRNSYSQRYIETTQNARFPHFQVFYPEESVFNFNYKYLFLLLIFGLLYQFGQQISPRMQLEKLENWIKPQLKTILFCLCIFLFFSLTPLFIVFKNLGPSRAWISLNVVFSLIVFFFVFYLGMKSKIKFSTYFLLPNFISFIVLFSIYNYKQQIKTQQYALEFDQLITEVKSFTKTNKPLIISKPLPDSGVISYATISKNNSTDTSLTSYYFLKVLNRNNLLFIR